jgi:hypothetical protein
VDTKVSPHFDEQTDQDPGQIIEIRDQGIDVEEIMARIRANVARRREEGAYQEDLDAITEEVYNEVTITHLSQDVSPTTAGSLANILGELNRRWVIREVPFTSDVPVIGGLIVTVRNFWNWMSTKWYVQGLLQQQTEFNALVARAFNEMNAERQSLADEVRQLKVVCEQQQEDIDQLKQIIEQLESPRAIESGR